MGGDRLAPASHKHPRLPGLGIGAGSRPQGLSGSLTLSLRMEEYRGPEDFPEGLKEAGF